MTEYTAWTCERHGITQPDNETYCPTCMALFATRRDAGGMTVDERITEMQSWSPQLTIPFTDLHQRITELMGRSVWTHELADPDLLYEELRSGVRASINDVIGKLPVD